MTHRHGRAHSVKKTALQAALVGSAFALAACTSSAGSRSASTGTAQAVGGTAAAASSSNFCSTLSDSKAIRSLSGSLPAIAAGNPSAAQRTSATTAVSDIRALAKTAPAQLTGQFNSTSVAITGLLKGKPTKSSVTAVVNSFAQLDKRVRATCHFPLR